MGEKDLTVGNLTTISIGAAVWIASKIVPFSYSEWSFFIGLVLSSFLMAAEGSYLEERHWK